MQVNVLLNRITTALAIAMRCDRHPQQDYQQDYQQEQPPAEHGEQFLPLRLSAKNFYIKGVTFN